MSINNKRAVFDLFLISALGLFIELIFIRWVASEIRVFAFYKNFALIAAFLGLGIGFAVRRQKGSQNWFERFYFPMLALIVVVVLVLGRTAVSEVILLNTANTQEFIWAGGLTNESPLVIFVLDVLFYSVLLAMFILLTALFIPLGWLVASKFAGFRPLVGYMINISGSLAGILLYALISLLGWPPVTWFLMAGIGALYFFPRDNRRKWAINGGWALLPIALTLWWPNGAEQTYWSPYYRIDIDTRYAANDPDLQLGYVLSVNKAWHQRLWNLEPGFVEANYQAEPEHFDTMTPQYNVPYQIAPRLDSVLIVGAGTGNDVAGALRTGAGHVVAVEIDPLIFELGERLHPEGPYDDPSRVTQVNQDARSFFRRDQGSYDLIVFGLLDSHTLFGGGSSVRLDNFVYTHESLTEVRGLLAEDGLLALSFGVPAENVWVGLRIYRTLTDVFGHEPQVYSYLNNDTLFLIANDPITEPLIDNPNVIPRPDYSYDETIEPTTDDWPYLYLRDRTLPTNYLVLLVGIIVVTVLFVRRTLPDFREVNLHFFFMGTAFFLLETKSVTEMALLFGSTWIVNTAVIASILTMIIVANILVEQLKWTNPMPVYVLLALALAFNYFVPVSSFLGLAFVWRIVLASIAQAIPLFFAGIIFAITFSQTDSIEVALGSNLIGAVLGGVFEYTSLVLGVRGLYILALLFYLLSALPLLRSGAKRLSVIKSGAD